MNKLSGTELFNEVEALMGGECHCGGKGLECIQEEGGCCSEGGIGDLFPYCQKETLTKLKEALDDLDEFRCEEKEAWKKKKKRKEAFLKQEEANKYVLLEIAGGGFFITPKEEEEEGENDCN